MEKATLEYLYKNNYKSFARAMKGQNNHIYRMCKKFDKDVNLIKDIYNEEK